MKNINNEINSIRAKKKRDKITTKIIPIEIPIPIFKLEEHPKKFLKALNAYLEHRKALPKDHLLIIETSLKRKAEKRFTMVKDMIIIIEMLRELFLKHFFLEVQSVRKLY